MIPDIDFGRMFVAIATVGIVIGGATVALMLLAWPWLWALAKPALHALTA